MAYGSGGDHEVNPAWPRVPSSSPDDGGEQTVRLGRFGIERDDIIGAE